MGLAIGWRRALQVPNMVPAVVHDSTQMFAVVLDLSVFGRVLAVTPYISPSHEYPQQKEVLQHMSALAYVVCASPEVIGGDFNMAQDSQRNALPAALRPTFALGTFVPVFPLGTITNVTYDQGLRRCMAIDHILVRRHTQIVESAVLPSPTLHSLLFAVVGTRQSLPDIRSWKFVS